MNSRDSQPIVGPGWRPALALATGLCAVLPGIAFVAAPHACEWGLTVYAWSGLAAIIALATIPAWLLCGLGTWKVILATLGFGALGIVVVLGSLVAADMQVICRLF